MMPVYHHKGRVLLVDDEVDIREVLCEVLTAEGYHCSSAGGGMEALEVLRQQPFDLVILDIFMPGMSGLECFPHIRSEFPDVAILFLTALSEVDTAVGSMKSGAYDYITKPMHIDSLLEKVAEALTRRQAHLEERRSHQALESNVGELSQIVDNRTRELKALNRFIQRHLEESQALSER